MTDVKEKTKKTRIKRREIRKQWKDFEEFALLNYVRHAKENGYEFEFPNAGKYYRRLISKVGIQNVDEEQIRSKMRNLKGKYVAAVDWQCRTGQGVESGSVRAAVLKMCPHYDILEDIFGEKVSFLLPYLYDNLENNNNGDGNSCDQQNEADSGAFQEENDVNKTIELEGDELLDRGRLIQRRDSNEFDINQETPLEDSVIDANNENTPPLNGNPSQIYNLESQSCMENEFIDSSTSADNLSRTAACITGPLIQTRTNSTERQGNMFTSRDASSTQDPISALPTSNSNLRPSSNSLNNLTSQANVDRSSNVVNRNNNRSLSPDNVSHSRTGIPRLDREETTRSRTIYSRLDIEKECDSQTGIPRLDREETRPTECNRERISRFKGSLSALPQSKNGFNPKIDHEASNAAAVIGSALIQRSEAIKQKNENDLMMKQQELKIAKEKMEFEKDIRMKELKLREEEIKSNERIRILQLEKEERLAELKIRLEMERRNPN